MCKYSVCIVTHVLSDSVVCACTYTCHVHVECIPYILMDNPCYVTCHQTEGVCTCTSEHVGSRCPLHGMVYMSRACCNMHSLLRNTVWSYIPGNQRLSSGHGKGVAY